MIKITLRYIFLNRRKSACHPRVFESGNPFRESAEVTHTLPHRVCVHSVGTPRHPSALHRSLHLFLFLFLLRMISSSKGCSPKRHPFTRVSFLRQSLQADIGKRILSSPPASLLPRYDRNRIRAGRRTKTRLKGVIQANVCLVRLLCQNQIIADSQQ